MFDRAQLIADEHAKFANPTGSQTQAAVVGASSNLRRSAVSLYFLGA
jgi:hypothetical protein